MKVLGGPITSGYTMRIANDDYNNAVRYALSIPGVAVAVIGCETLEHLERAAEAVRNFSPLSEQEAADLSAKGEPMATEWGALYWGTTT